MSLLVHVAPGVEAAAIAAFLTVIVVVPVVVIDGPPRFGRDARAFLLFRTRRRGVRTLSHLPLRRSCHAVRGHG